MSIPSITGLAGIGGVGALTGSSAATYAAGVDPTGPSAAPQGPTGPAFGQLIANGVDRLEAMNDRTDNLAVQAATGDLSAIHDYTIAATETSVATQLTVAVRNKAIEAFNEIMRMQV